MEKRCRVLYLGPELPTALSGFSCIKWIKSVEILPLPEALRAAAEYVVRGDYDCVAFLSPRSPRFLRQFMSSWPPNVRAFAVGASTAASVREAFGIDAPYPETYSSGGLAELIKLSHCRRVLSLRSEAGDHELEEKLREAGIEVNRVDVYREVPADIDINELASRFDLIIVSSAEIARISCNHVRPYLGDAIVIAMGPKAASAVSSMCPEARLLVPSRYTFNAIGELLKALGCR